MAKCGFCSTVFWKGGHLHLMNRSPGDLYARINAYFGGKRCELIGKRRRRWLHLTVSRSVTTSSLLGMLLGASCLQAGHFVRISPLCCGHSVLVLRYQPASRLLLDERLDLLEHLGSHRFGDCVCHCSQEPTGRKSSCCTGTNSCAHRERRPALIRGSRTSALGRDLLDQVLHRHLVNALVPDHLCSHTPACQYASDHPQ
jgi:hypothetical protein